MTRRVLDEREAAVAVLHDAYLACKLGAVCDAILTAGDGREPEGLLLDATQLRAITKAARANPAAWLATEQRMFATGPGANKRWRTCRDCPNLIPPTYTRGQPAKRCAECRGVKPGDV